MAEWSERYQAQLTITFNNIHIAQSQIISCSNKNMRESEYEESCGTAILFGVTPISDWSWIYYTNELAKVPSPIL